jgi:predicted Zn-dependent protease with MMP-like domain
MRAASLMRLFCYSLKMQLLVFEKMVAEGFDRLPEWVRKKISNVAILIEDLPSEEVRKEEGLEDDETLLGLYRGIPLSARGDTYGVGATLPDTITLYKIPIEEAAIEDGMDVQDVVAETIWHEFAHHFGMDEGEVRKREQERF